jgi:hypothetical protein
VLGLTNSCAAMSRLASPGDAVSSPLSRVELGGERGVVSDGRPVGDLQNLLRRSGHEAPREVDPIRPEVPDGWLTLDQAAAKALGVVRQTVLHKVQRGELEAVHVTTGRRKGLRIHVNQQPAGLFDTP